MAWKGDQVRAEALEAMPDGRLLEVAQGGNARAFAVLYERYWYRLFVFCRRRVVDRQVAEDLVQETMLTAWTRLHDCEQWSAWVHVIARNKCVSYVRADSVRLRRIRSHGLDGIDGGSTEVVAPSSEEVCERRAAAQRLLVAVGRLPPRQHGVVRRRLAGASFREIAEQLHISPKLARQAAYDARRRLRVEQETVSP